MTLASASAHLVVAMARPRVLIIEEEGTWKNILVHSLETEGYETIVARDRCEGVRLARALQPNLILLGLRPPLSNSMEVCRQLREAKTTGDIPILMLTVARGKQPRQVTDAVFGPDDHVIGPVAVRALVQRLKVLQRRKPDAEAQPQVVEHHGVRIDHLQHRAYVGDREVHLTPTEFRLLERFLRHPGRAFTRTQLTDAAIGEGALVLERTIDVHLKALRKKLGAAGDLIETVRGIGYRFREYHG